MSSPAAQPAPPVEFLELSLPTDERRAQEALQPFIERFRLHPLTVEDCIKRNQRCKLETFEDYLFLVWHFYCPREEHYREVQLCISASAILVVAEEPPSPGGSWREYLLRARGSDSSINQAAIAVLDRLVDDAEGYLDVLQDGAASLEADILAQSMDPASVVYLKGLVRQFSRSMRSAQPVASQVIELGTQLPRMAAFSPDERLRLRNVTDHMTRLLEATQLLEGQMGALMDVHWGAVGARTNRQMQRLTTIATVFLPVGFWSGLFGMNFESLPFKETWFFAAGLTAILLTWVSVMVYMLRRGMFDHEQSKRHKPLFPPTPGAGGAGGGGGHP